MGAAVDIASAAAMQPYRAVGLALALGLLIGMQRGWALRAQGQGTRFAGIRTYGLLGLAGGIAGLLNALATGLATVLLVATAALVVLGYWRSSAKARSISGTASLTGLLVLACGFLAATGMELPATIITVGMLLLLSLRTRLHGLIARMEEVEVLAIARFALIALVILPLLPDRSFGPYGAWNPHQLWLVVVLVSGFSFAGYIANRQLGASRGTIATAAAGSVVSSTAVTAALATRMRDAGDASPILAAGITTASAIMFLRVMVLTGMLAPFALPTLAMLAAPGLIVSLAATGWALWKARTSGAIVAQDMDVRNPFDLGPALLLMALVMVLTLIARWVLHHYGDMGLATVLALSGMLDVDSAIITLGSLPRGALSAQMAGLVLLPPILLNTLVKAGLTISIAGWQNGRYAALTLVASVVAALLALPLVLL